MYLVIYRLLSKHLKLKLNDLFMMVKDELDTQLKSHQNSTSTITSTSTTNAKEELLMGIFNDNFLLMNGLYQLQQHGLEQQIFSLDIGSLWIELMPFKKAQETKLKQGASAIMSEYYLNWNNFTTTTPEQVVGYLKQFWSFYQGSEHIDDALSCLGCEKHDDWQQIKQQYKKLSLQHHPDRDGSHQEFQQIQQAYQQLKVHYAK